MMVFWVSVGLLQTTLHCSTRVMFGNFRSSKMSNRLFISRLTLLLTIHSLLWFLVIRPRITWHWLTHLILTYLTNKVGHLRLKEHFLIPVRSLTSQIHLHSWAQLTKKLLYLQIYSRILQMISKMQVLFASEILTAKSPIVSPLNNVRNWKTTCQVYIFGLKEVMLYTMSQLKST